MRFFIPVHHTQGASRHHGGAAIGDMGTIYRLKRRQILSRFPTQNRAIKRGSNRPSALPTASRLKIVRSNAAAIALKLSFEGGLCRTILRKDFLDDRTVSVELHGV